MANHNHPYNPNSLEDTISHPDNCSVCSNLDRMTPADLMRNPMTPNEYQQLSKRTLLDTPDQPLTPKETMIIWGAVGIAGEAGEIVELLKKAIFHRHGITPEVIKQLAGELGHLAWFWYNHKGMYSPAVRTCRC